LGKSVGTEHLGRYDLVIGNPPWASSTKLPGWSEVQDIVTRIAKDRLALENGDSLLPNQPLDLPFVWRAMEWAKPGAQISFALHARLLFQQADGMATARSTLFRALDVSAVLNGAELRQTRVWPEISAPFCLLFARNRKPPSGAAFRFISPHLENDLNNGGVLRLDVMNSERVTPQQVAARPEILKVLFRGSSLDIEVFERITNKDLKPLLKCWQERFGSYMGGSAQTGNGYQQIGSSSRIRKNGDGKRGVSAQYLIDLQFTELTSQAFQCVLIKPEECIRFTQQRIHDPRPASLFHGPLLLVRESPSAQSQRILASISDIGLIFNKSYQGYSAFGDIDGKQLVRYLALVLGSKLAIWYALMVSGRFGIEREVIERVSIDNIVLVPFEALEAKELKQINSLFEVLKKENNCANWAKVDAWIAELYGLTERDLQVIDDTLRFNLPFAANKKAAQIPPSPQEIDVFCEALKSELIPWAEREDKEIEVKRIPVAGGSPWVTVCISSSMANLDMANSRQDGWPEILRIANDLATTEIICPDAESGCLWMARLNQARYWSRSQARLAARRIVWEHLDALLGSDEA
jgi:hypothetical protein